MASPGMVELQVEYNNEIMTITVDDYTAEQLNNDHAFALSFMQANFGNSQQSCYPPPPDFSVTEEDADDPDDEEGTEAEFSWTHELVQLMIVTRLENDGKFQAPTKKKSKIWEEVARGMKRAAPGRAALVTGSMCDKKWRNLMITYKKILVNNNKTGRGHKNWPYFDIMNNALGNRANIKPPEILLGGSFPDEDLPVTSKGTESTSAASTSAALPAPSPHHLPMPSSSWSSRSPTPPSQLFSRSAKKKSELSFLKQELDARTLREEEKRADKRARWDEKLQLEKERTDAIKSLTEAIKAFTKRD